MLLNFVIIASTIGAQAAASDAKRRQEQGLPPLPAPPLPTWKDKCADVAFWLFIFSPEIAIVSIVGMGMFIVLEIAFARQGITFP